MIVFETTTDTKIRTGEVYFMLEMKKYKKVTFYLPHAVLAIPAVN